MTTSKEISLFETTIPLQLWIRNSYGLNYANIVSTEIELYGNTRLIDFKNPKIVFTIKDYPEKFLKYEILEDVGGGGNGLFHESTLERLNKLCSQDIQIFNVTIINDPKLKKSFENKDYYVFNILNEIDALDEERSEIENVDLGTGRCYRRVGRGVFKNDAWNGHLIAKDRISRRRLWHPRLAREFKTAKGIKFITAEGGIEAK